LLLTTLNPTLETVSEESLMTSFAPDINLAVFEGVDGTIFFASPWFGWETLEIRRGSTRESFHLDLRPGGFVDILPGPSRVYVVSTADRPEAPVAESPYGLRVQALDFIRE
jgi:hypothetical protein